MKKWTMAYKVLTGLSVLFAVATVLAHYYLLRPLRLELAAGEDLAARKSAAITARNWPLAPHELDGLRRQQRLRLSRLGERLEEVQGMAKATFAEAIRGKLGIEAVEDPGQFIAYVTRLDYQEYFSEIITKWQAKNVALRPQVLNLTEDASSPYVYRLILQLWTLDAALEAVAESGMVPVVRPTAVGAGSGGESITVEAAQVAVQEIREYRLDRDSKQGYLLELPVQVTARGTAGQLLSLLDRLAESEAWMAVNAVEIRKQPMRRLARPDDRLEVFLELSTFYPLKLETEIKIESPGELVPRGA